MARPSRWSRACFAVALAFISVFKASRACEELTDATASQSELILLKNFHQVLKCNNIPGILVFPYIWGPTTVTVDCGKLQPVSAAPGFGADALRPAASALCSESSAAEVSLRVMCMQYQIYMGGTPDEVTQRWTDGEQAWCSLYSTLRRKGCQLQLSPFSTSYIGLRKTPNLGA